MELIKVEEKTYYIKNNTNIGVYKINDNEVYLIDSGNDKKAGIRILKIIEEQEWVVKGIINTHSNADHIGGNSIIQERTNCEILTYGIESCFTKFPILESSFVYGSYPFNELRDKFIMAKESNITEINNNLPKGLEYFILKGHFFDMIGIKTSDDVYFLGDSIFSEEIISKYHIFFLYNVDEYLNTLEYLKTLKGKLFIPSHANATDNISSLIDINKFKIEEISEKILKICQNSITFEEILKKIFDEYNLTMNTIQYMLIGSTIKGFLSYLSDNNKIQFSFENNKMFWKTI